MSELLIGKICLNLFTFAVIIAYIFGEVSLDTVFIVATLLMICNELMEISAKLPPIGDDDGKM